MYLLWDIFCNMTIYGFFFYGLLVFLNYGEMSCYAATVRRCTYLPQWYNINYAETIDSNYAATILELCLLLIMNVATIMQKLF
jgi:hypothetical protein